MYSASYGGSWTITSNFYGTATGSSSPNPIAGNLVNQIDISNSTITFATNTTAINMGSHAGKPVSGTATATANTSGAHRLFNIQWIPAQGQTLVTDPPPSTVGVSLTLTVGLAVQGNTNSIAASISATAGASADGITWPTLSGSAGGTMVEFSTQKTYVVKRYKSLSVDSTGLAQLDVAMSTSDHAEYTISGGGTTGSTGGTTGATSGGTTGVSTGSTGGLDGGGIGGGGVGGGDDSPYLYEPPSLWDLPAGVMGTSGVTPAVAVVDIILTVPQQGIYPRYRPATDSANKYVFDSASPGVLANPDWESLVIGDSPSNFLPNTTYTSFTISGSTRTEDTISISGQVIRQRFTYTTLPALNSAFGDKDVTMTCTGPVSTTQTSHVRVFFAKGATNHPDPDAPTKAGRTPNWFFYWRQTDAGGGLDNYYGGAGSGSPTGRCYYDSTTHWTCLIYDGAATGPYGALYGGAKGIDLYAHIARHEDRHKQDMTGFWGNADRVPAQDADGDYLPGSQEPTIGAPYHSGGYDPNVFATFPDHFNYGNPTGWSDAEDYCMHREASWSNGSANDQDWAKPGKQWE